MTSDEAERLRTAYRVISDRYDRATDLRIKWEDAGMPIPAEKADLRACALAWALDQMHIALADLGINPVSA